MSDANSTDDALPYLWTADLGAIRTAVGLADGESHRVIARLQRAVMIYVAGGQGRRGMCDGMYLVNEVTERGLRAAGAWPSEAEALAVQLIAALTEAAENEPDPEQRSKLRAAVSSLGAVGQKTVVEIVASYLAKTTGA